MQAGLRRIQNREAISRFSFLLLFAMLCLLLLCPQNAPAGTRAERVQFQKSIIDRRANLNRSFRKTVRQRTDYIIVHTSEGGLKSTLRTVSTGKVVKGRRITPGGHAHYVISRDGRTFRTLDKRYVADHAGRSLWNGTPNLSRVSLGIELVGYHYTKITDKQYRSLGLLLELLQGVYGLDDRQVLTHSQVAYGKPNRWVREEHRGRKRCAKNFDRSRAGLESGWAFDPDVRSGRLAADVELAAVFYGTGSARSGTTGSNVISAGNTAWNIAGEDYDDATTLYRLPGGRVVPGNSIDRTLGWDRIPKGTVVLLNEEEPVKKGLAENPVKTIDNGLTAWTLAGADYRKETTIYIFPDGKVKTGRQISDWDGLPSGTRLLVGYRGPYHVTSSRPPIRIAGDRYDDGDTVYLFPNRDLRTGNRIANFKALPRGVHVFLSVGPS